MATLQNLTWDQMETYLRSRTDVSQAYKDGLNLATERAAYNRPITMYNAMVSHATALNGSFRWANWDEVGLTPINMREEMRAFIDDARRLAEEAVAYINASGG